MDPNETLRLLRQTIKQMAVEEKGGLMWTAHAAEVTEYWTALDEWLASGGFPPAEWRHVKVCTVATADEEIVVSVHATGADAYETLRSNYALEVPAGDIDAIIEAVQEQGVQFSVVEHEVNL